jgi:hypothetical protein
MRFIKRPTRNYAGRSELPTFGCGGRVSWLCVPSLGSASKIAIDNFGWVRSAWYDNDVLRSDDDVCISDPFSSTIYAIMVCTHGTLLADI